MESLIAATLIGKAFFMLVCSIVLGGIPAALLGMRLEQNYDLERVNCGGIIVLLSFIFGTAVVAFGLYI